MMAAEMAVIRLTHVADLPSPEELIRRLQDSPPPPGPPPPGQCRPRNPAAQRRREPIKLAHRVPAAAFALQTCCAAIAALHEIACFGGKFGIRPGKGR